MAMSGVRVLPGVRRTAPGNEGAQRPPRLNRLRSEADHPRRRRLPWEQEGLRLDDLHPIALVVGAAA